MPPCRRRSPPLTDVQIKNAKPQSQPYKLADGGGLYLEVLPMGGKSWRMKYRCQGKEKRLVFGLWPDVSLKQARQRRDEARVMVADGVDPGEKRKQDKAEEKAQAAEDANTFEKVAREWHARQVAVWSQGHADKVLTIMGQYLFPAIGSVPISQLRAPAILPILREVEAKGINYTAKRLRQYCEAVFTYAVAVGLAERNVGADLRGALAPCRVKNRPAITEPKAVGKLLRAMWDYEGSPSTLAALKLSALLFVRPGELRQAEWAEIDLDAPDGPRWLIPAEKMKMRSPHHVPLPRQAVEIITELHSLTGSGRYLFPCNRTKGRCMSNMTINAALRRLGYEQGEHCAHGFRAMASTLLNEQGWSSDVIERQLAHAPRNKVRAVYNRAEYLPERRKMMQAWADCPCDADGQVSRVAARFGLVAAAGELGISYGVLPWPKGEARQAAARCFRDWLDARGGSGAAEVTSGLAQVRQFFQVNGAARFETWGDVADAARIINRAGFRRKDEDTGEWSFYVFQDVFKAEVCQGHNSGMILRELKARGLLLVQDAEHLTVKPRIPGVGGSTRFYHIAPGITGDAAQLRTLQNAPGTTGDTGDTASNGAGFVPGQNDEGEKMEPAPMWDGPAEVEI